MIMIFFQIQETRSETVMNTHCQQIENISPFPVSLDINSPSPCFYLLFSRSILSKDVDAVEELLASGVDVDIATKRGRTPLHLAASHDEEDDLPWLDIANRLLEKDPQILKEFKHGYAPLHCACKKGHLGMVIALLCKGADLDGKDDIGQTALHLASVNGHLDVAERLVEAGSSLNATRNDGKSPLLCAATAGRDDVVEYLLEKGANANERDHDGRTPLHVATAMGKLDLVKSLVSKGADVTVVDNSGRTPFDHAKGSIRQDVEEFLSSEVEKVKHEPHDDSSLEADTEAAQGTDEAAER